MANQVVWSRIFLEGAVIVGSILLALTADAWWDERQEREAEAEAVLGLDTDFSENLAGIHNSIASHEDFVRRLARLEAMTGAERRTAPADSVASFAYAMATPSTFATHDGTLDALIASGQLGIIEMPELSDGLVTWKRLVGDLEEEATRLYDAAVSVNERLLALGGPWTWRPEILDATPGLREARSRSANADLETLADDAELQNRVQQKLWLTAIYLDELRRMAGHAESVLRMTETYFDTAAVVTSVSVQEYDQLSSGSNFIAPPEAWAVFSDERRRRVDFDADWSSSDSTIVDAWAARRPGQAEVCATYRGVRGCATHVVVR